MADTAQDLAELVDTVVSPLLSVPEDLEITAVEEESAVSIEIRVNPDDAGKVIGRQGRTIKAIRTLTRAAASKYDIMVDVELLD